MSKYQLRYSEIGGQENVIELDNVTAIMDSSVTSAVAAVNDQGRFAPIANYATEMRYTAQSSQLSPVNLSKMQSAAATLLINGVGQPVVVTNVSSNVAANGRVTADIEMSAVGGTVAIQNLPAFEPEPEPEPPDPQEVWDALSRLEDF